MELIVSFIIGIALGSSITYIVVRILRKGDINKLDEFRQLSDEQKSRITELETRLSNANEELGKLRTDLAVSESKRDTEAEKNRKLELERSLLSAEKNDLLEQKAKLEESLRKEREMQKESREHADKLLGEQIERIQAQLTNTTQKLLDERGGKLAENNRTQMSAIIEPLKETIVNLKKEMQETQTQHGQTTTRLQESIHNLIEKTETVGARADRLVETLLYKPKSQGDWGELIVKGILDSMNFREGVHYEYQPTLRDENGIVMTNDESAKRMRPDFILHLSEKEDVVIDSKMTITSYDNYVHAKTDEERQQYADEITASIKGHIEELKKANYSGYTNRGKQFVNFVFMFIPNEGAFQVAMAYNKNLWHDTFINDRIFIVSEMNLYAALKVVDNTWQQIERNRNYDDVFKRVGELLDRLNSFIEEYNSMGNALKTLQNKYDSASNSLKGSSQSVLAKGNRLMAMGVVTKKKLPQAEQLSLGE